MKLYIQLTVVQLLVVQFTIFVIIELKFQGKNVIRT